MKVLKDGLSASHPFGLGRFYSGYLEWRWCGSLLTKWNYPPNLGEKLSRWPMISEINSNAIRRSISRSSRYFLTRPLGRIGELYSSLLLQSRYWFKWVTPLFSHQYWLLWALVLGIALWFPLRQLIWTMTMRRLYKKKLPLDATVSDRIKRKASLTSILISMLFAIFYTQYLFR